MLTGSAIVAEAPKLVSVKIDAEVYRMVKTVAAWKDVNIHDYLTSLVRSLVERDFAKIGKDIRRSSDQSE